MPVVEGQSKGPTQNDNPIQQVGGQQQQQGFFSTFFTTFSRILLVYYAINYFKGNTQTISVQSHDAQGQLQTKSVSHVEPIWHSGDLIDIHVHLSELPKTNPSSTPFWKSEGLVFGNLNYESKAEFQVPLSERVQNNGSLYAHIRVMNKGTDPKSTHLKGMLQTSKLLTRYLPKKKEKVKKNLLDGQGGMIVEEKEDPNKPRPILSYWWQNVTVNLVAETEKLPVAISPHVQPYIKLSEDKTHYYPILWMNDFWLLQENLQEINMTTPVMNMTIHFYQLPMWKFQLYAQFTQSIKMQNEMMGVAEAETDEMKRMFLETNPILLAVTFTVSLLHSIFDFLAFKNDIQFWKNKKDMEGMSFRAILLNVFFQTVILLYLFDNETSWMILLSSSIGLFIEIWKIQKTVYILQHDKFPYIKFVDKIKPSKKVSETQKYDEIAFNYLSKILFPLLILYSIYSMMYEQHKSWYSFVLGTLVGFVYAFGFITMTPQLYINYKLKSVANMPWKTFMYKALNTFIDDLFAFVIKMPTLHRLACLRDDVIFLIYLYQRWIYVEDKTRPNEFGQVGQVEEEHNDEKSEEKQKLIEEDGKTKKD